MVVSTEDRQEKGVMSVCHAEESIDIECIDTVETVSVDRNLAFYGYILPPNRVQIKKAKSSTSSCKQLEVRAPMQFRSRAIVIIAFRSEC